MKLISHPCILCNSKEFKPLIKKDRYGFYFISGICKHCGLLQIYHRPSKKDMVNFYKKQYSKIYRENKKPDNLFFFHLYQKGEFIYKFLQKYLGPIKNKKILEIGTSSGGVLQYFKNKNNHTIGVDLDQDYIKFGCNKGLNLINGTIDNIHSSHDIIIYSHVLEHLSDPIQELRKARRLLNKNGILYIEVPGLKSFDNYHHLLKRGIQFTHISYFSFETLYSCLIKSGFQLINKDNKICSIWKKNKIQKLINHYDTTLRIIDELKEKKIKWYKKFYFPYVFLKKMGRRNKLISSIYYNLLRKFQ